MKIHLVGPGGAGKNVDVYRSIAAEGGVIALSSGFMTYAEEVHPENTRCRAFQHESRR